MTTPPPQNPDGNNQFPGQPQQGQPGGYYQAHQPHAPYNPGQPGGMPGDFGPPAYPGPGQQKSKKGLIIGAVVGVLVVIAIILAIVFLTKGSGTSKEDYQSGIEQIISEALGSEVNPEDATKIAECIADQTYSEVSEDTLALIASGEDVMPGNEDFGVISGSSMDCTLEVLTP
ncbi:MAG: hypothetical protein Q4P33_07895 [Flaviflexus sp.]|nr:hypothetical protein [Flaviflexus sp.]